MEVFGYIASLVMGIILGLVGGGGSILTVPIMVYLFGLSPTVATSHSLFVVGVSALIGSVIYMRRGDVDYKVGFYFAIPSIVGVTVSRGLLLPAIPASIGSFFGFTLTKEVLVMGSFAALMMSASYSMIRQRDEKKAIKANHFLLTGLIIFQGFIVGAVVGFVGAGGGFLIIPALVILTGLSMRVAIGTSLMIIALQSLVGFAGDLSRGVMVHWSLLAIVAAIAIGGILAGSAISHKIKEQRLKIAFGWFVLFMGALILIEQSRHL